MSEMLQIPFKCNFINHIYVSTYVHTYFTVRNRSMRSKSFFTVSSLTSYNAKYYVSITGKYTYNEKIAYYYCPAGTNLNFNSPV